MLAGLQILRPKITFKLRATERAIRDSVRNEMAVAEKNGFKSIAFPLIGAESGGFDQEKAKELRLDELQKLDSLLAVTVVGFREG